MAEVIENNINKGQLIEKIGEKNNGKIIQRQGIQKNYQRGMGSS